MAHGDHIVDMRFRDYVLRVFQAFITMIAFALSTYQVAMSRATATELSLFTSSWTIMVLGYYLISVHALKMLYNWAVILFLEFSLVALWASSIGTLAKEYSDLTGDYYWEYNGALIALLVFAGIAFILQVVTFLTLMSRTREHRRQGLPLWPSDHTTDESNLRRESESSSQSIEKSEV